MIFFDAFLPIQLAFALKPAYGSPMNPRVLTIQGQLPIPVGHRVEVIYFLLRTGLFSGEMTRDEWKPLVRDLVTGGPAPKSLAFQAT